MDKAIYTNDQFTFTLEADQRERRMKLTIQYKGTKQVDTLPDLNATAVMIWIGQRMHECFDFHFHTTGHRDPLNYRAYKQHLIDHKDVLLKEVLHDTDILMMIELSEALADFLEEEDAYDKGACQR